MFSDLHTCFGMDDLDCWGRTVIAKYGVCCFDVGGIMAFFFIFLFCGCMDWLV